MMLDLRDRVLLSQESSNVVSWCSPNAFPHGYLGSSPKVALLRLHVFISTKYDGVSVEDYRDWWGINRRLSGLVHRKERIGR